MSIIRCFNSLGQRTGLFEIFTLFLLLIALPGAASAAIEDKVYAANSCRDLSQQAATEGTAQFIWNGNEGIFGNTQGSSGVTRVVCPIVRQKVGSSTRAYFYVYFSAVFYSLGDRVSCTMSSRKNINGSLVSTVTAGNVNQGSSLVRLFGFLPITHHIGHLSLQCTTNNIFNVMHNYRIREI